MNTALFLFIYTVAAFGLAWIIGHASISYRPRRWLLPRLPGLVVLLECPACAGFWIGVCVASVAACRLPWSVGNAIFLGALPFYTAGSNYILGRAVGLISEESP